MNKLIMLMFGAFVASNVVADASTSLTITRATDGTGYPILTWDGDEIEVSRSYKESGPFTVIADNLEAATYTDTDAYYGVKTYYKVGDLVTSFTRMRRIGQDENSNLETNVTVKWDGYNYAGGNEYGSNCFDGNLDTQANLVSGSVWGSAYNAPVGLALTNAAHIALTRVIALGSGQYSAGRVDGACVFGSNDSSKFDGTQIGGPLNYGSWDDYKVWKDIACDTANSYSFIYVKKVDTSNPSCGNYAEIQFYGWYDSDVAGLTDPISSVTAKVNDGEIIVSWACTGKPDSYVLERKVGDGEWATIDTYTDTDDEYAERGYTDTDVTYYSNYTYRVSANYDAFDTKSTLYTDSLLCVEPICLVIDSVGRDTSAGSMPVLTWQNCDALPTTDKTAIYRSDDNGEWVKIASVDAGTLTYTNNSANSYGVLYRYYVSVENAIKPSAIINYYKTHRLERDPETSNSQLRSGYQNICSFGNGNGTQYWDGNITSYYSTDGSSWGSPICGVYFNDEDIYLAWVRIHPRTDRYTDLVGLHTSGSLLSSSPWNDYTRIAEDLTADQVSDDWFSYECDPSSAWKSIIFHGNWWGHATEIEMYGWTQYDLDAQAGLVTAITTSFTDSKATIAWECTGTPVNYTIERKLGEEEWTTIATLTSADASYTSHSYDDLTVAYGSTYSYRVSAIYPKSSSTSSESAVTIYETFTLERADMFTTGYAKLDWNAPTAFASGVKVERKKSTDDAWTVIATLNSGINTYTDESLKFDGDTYYYRLSAINGNAITLPSVGFVRAHRLERKSSSEMSTGVSVLTYNTHTWYGNGEGVAFDGNIGTSPDLGSNTDSNPRIGVDFGEGARYHVVLARVYPRGDYGLPGTSGNRQTGLAVYGLNSDWISGTGVALSEQLTSFTSSSAYWYELPCDPTIAIGMYTFGIRRVVLATTGQKLSFMAGSIVTAMARSC